MVRGDFHQHYQVDKILPTPIYIQLVRAVVFAIREGRLLRGDAMPSINVLAAHYQVTRSTIEKGYAELRDMGIIGSHQGKGFFVKNTDLGSNQHVHEAHSSGGYHQAIYDTFAEKLGSEVTVEAVNLKANPEHLIRLLQEKQDDDTEFFIVTIPKQRVA